jgi:hypothetical protein
VPAVQIPRTTIHRREMTFATLLLRVYLRRPVAAFEGKSFKPGALIDEAELWPTPEYPPTPVLLEFAGKDHSGWGHRRSNSIWVLWKYDPARARWSELLKYTGQGTEWQDAFKRTAFREIARETPPVDAATAAAVSGRVLGVLDSELELLSAADRLLVMNYIYQEFSARAIAFTC